MDPLDRVAIIAGHRALLATLRELLAGIDRSAGGADEESLRATVAFLRQSVLPFSWNEERLLDRGEARETTTLEHAFLAAEIDRLADETSLLLALPLSHPSWPDTLLRVRRLAWRIEVVLELHSLRDEESGGTEPPLAGPRPLGGSAPAPRDLPVAEMKAFLQRRAWGTLCTIDRGSPYAVPVSFAFADDAVYLATGPGRKAEALETAGACLSVVDVVSGERWTSVLVTGPIEWLDDDLSRARAARVLVAQRGRSGGQLSERDRQRLSAARFLRLRADQISGRSRGEPA